MSVNPVIVSVLIVLFFVCFSIGLSFLLHFILKNETLGPFQIVLLILSVLIELILLTALAYKILRYCKKKPESEGNRCVEQDQFCSYGSDGDSKDCKLRVEGDGKIIDTSEMKKSTGVHSPSKYESLGIYNDFGKDIAEDAEKPSDTQVEKKKFELNIDNRRSFHDVKMRKNTNLRMSAGSKRFTFHSVPERPDDLKIEHSQISKQDSFVGLPVFSNFDSFLTLVSIDSPKTPMTPREEFFSDLIKAADVENKRRSVLSQSAGNLSENAPTSLVHHSEEVSVDIENSPEECVKISSSMKLKKSDATQGHSFRLPSIVEVVEKNGNRLSVRGSVSEDITKPSSSTKKDSFDGLQQASVIKSEDLNQESVSLLEDDEVFSLPAKSDVSEIFVLNASMSPKFTAETFFEVKSD